MQLVVPCGPWLTAPPPPPPIPNHHFSGNGLSVSGGIRWGVVPPAAVPPPFVMKSNILFRDQVSAITSWFERWNSCEQTVGLYSLLKKLGPTQARFLALVLDQTLLRCGQLKQLEQEANDPNFVGRVASETEDNAVHILLSHLPLLHPGNENAKKKYLELIPNILAHSLRQGTHIEESRQLLSYSLIHPALSREERRILNLWMKHLEECIYGNFMDELNGGALSDQGEQNNQSKLGLGCLAGDTNGRDYGVDTPGAFMGQQHQSLGETSLNEASVDSGVATQLSTGSLDDGSMIRLRRSNSLTVQQTFSNQRFSANQKQQQQQCHKNACGEGEIQQQHSSLVPPPPISPQSSCGSGSGSEGGSGSTQNNHFNPYYHHHQQQQQQHNHHSSLLSSATATSSMTSSLPAHNNNNNNHHQQAYTCFGGNGRVSSVQPKTGNNANGLLCIASSNGSSSSTNNGNEHHFVGEGMREVPSWLKSLRLHKYSALFASLTYDEMLALTEQQLERRGVTQGARTKILLNIRKLRMRAQQLCVMEQDLSNANAGHSANLGGLFAELKGMVQTPMKPSPTNGDAQLHDDRNCFQVEDLPGSITRLMGKICSHLLVSRHLDDECCHAYIQLVDKCLAHEAFNDIQRRRLHSWKQQTLKVCKPRAVTDHTVSNPPLARRGTAESNGNHCSTAMNASSYLGASTTLSLPHSFHCATTAGFPGGPPPPGFSKRPTNGMHHPVTTTTTTSFSATLPPDIHRTFSAPNNNNNNNGASNTINGDFSRRATQAEDNEFNTRLESLCLSVTEHAIGGLDGVQQFPF